MYRGDNMAKLRLNIVLILFSVILSGCFLFPSDDLQSDEIPEEQIESYTAEIISQGFKFCPESYLEINVLQIHENPQFNFYNEVTADGELLLEIFGEDRHTGLRTKSDILLVGEGRAGVCQFTSSGVMILDIIGRLIPGENNQSNLLFSGQCESSVQSKPPCGDFGMIPLDKKVHVVIPYQDGGSFEWEWRNLNAGVSGRSKWTLHIPCEN
jgi:hypothetical protein